MKKISFILVLILVLCAIVCLAVFSSRHTHSFGEWTVVAEASCTTAGERTRVCECGGVEKETIPALAHDLGDLISERPSTCSENGAQIYTCKRDGCDYLEENPIDKLPHTAVKDKAVKPTKSSFGKTEGSHCSVCNEVIVPQTRVDKIPTIKKVDMLSSFSYEDKGKKLVFYWETADSYKDKLRKLIITVNADGASKTFEVMAKEGKFEFNPSITATKYRFSAAPVDKNFYQGNSLSSVCYWNPGAKKLSFPRVEITTLQGELPTYTPASAPSGCWGGGIEEANYVQSLVRVYNEDNELLYNSSSSDFSQAKIKIRGNTPPRDGKAPFKIKLTQKADLLLGIVERDETVDYKNKNWLLLKTGTDMDTAMGFTASSIVGRGWTPAYSYVSLFINGDFRGLYILCESVDDSEARCDISKTGYIIEMDAYYWKEPLYFETIIASAEPGKRPVGFTFKKPEDITASSPEVAYIQQYMIELETALTTGGDVSKYLDLRSCAEWLLAHDIIATWDSGGSNMYLTKYDNTDASIVYMGPNWDFDSIFWRDTYETDQFARIRTNDHFYMLWLVDNEQFQEIYKELYDEIKDSIMTEIKNELNRYATPEYSTLLKLDGERWNASHDSFSKQEKRVLSWFSAHLTWMDGAIEDWIG